MKTIINPLSLPKMLPANGRTLAVVAGIMLSIWMAWLFVAPEWGRFTSGDQIEYGDFANFALRIADAARLHEIYGHYSRYGFYHPGPAFWYLYAVGDFLLHDVLDIVSSAPFAHILTGTLFQCVCAVAAIFYLGRHARAAIVPLAIALLLYHWHSMIGAPTSIWPPHAMFGPYLLLLVFGAGVAAGSDRALPLMIFAGGMLVHCHVAQPLQVVPIGIAAILMWCQARRGGKFAGARPYILAALAVLALFVFPLALDLLRGDDSNMSVILKHIHDSSADRHSLSQGIGYFLGFFRYETTQETVQGAPDFLLLPYIGLHALSWAGSLIAVACGAALIFLKRTPQIVRSLVVLLALAILLSVAWSMFQDGGMYDYNGNYIYAVIYALYLLPIILAVQLLPQNIRWLQGTLMILGCMLALWSAHLAAKPLFTVAAPAGQLKVDLKRMAGDADLVQVTIEPGTWISAFAVVTQLDRMGIAFAVEPGYSFLRGERAPAVSVDGRKLQIVITQSACENGALIPSSGMEPPTFICPAKPL